MPETVTELTPEILGKTWKSPDAARMWLQRRGTKAETLGVTIKPTGEGNLVCLQRIERGTPDHVTVPTGTHTGEAKAHADNLLAASMMPAPGTAVASVSGPLPNALAYSESDAAVDRDADHPVQSVEAVAVDPRDAFEAYATEVDDLLQAQNEEAVTDDDLRPMWEFLLSAEDAVARIIQRRSAALEAEVEPLGVPGGEARTPIAPTVPAAVAEAREIVPPVPPVPPIPPVPPVPVSVAPAAPQPNPNIAAECQPAPSVRPGDLLLQLATPMDPSVASTWGAKLTKWAGCDVVAVDALTGVVAFTLPCKQPRKAPLAAANGDGRSRGEGLPKVMALLDRPGGCVGAEVRDALGWENVPGPFFFRQWAAKAGRELVSAKGDDGVWRFELAGAANG